MRTKDFYNYAVFTLSPGNCNNANWGDAVWTGEANGHDDALDSAAITPPDRNFAPMRVLTICLCDDGPPTMREHKVSRLIESVA